MASSTAEMHFDILATLKEMSGRYDKLDEHVLNTDASMRKLTHEVQKTQDDLQSSKLQQAADHTFIMNELKKLRFDIDARSTAPPSTASHDTSSSQRSPSVKRSMFETGARPLRERRCQRGSHFWLPRQVHGLQDPPRSEGMAR
jgi:hypothetical protein